MAHPKTVLITGCSDGGLGAGLVVAFHRRGHRIFATARNPDKMTALHNLGIDTLTLDVLSEASIKSCVEQVAAFTAPTSGGLDMLINNAGGG